MITTTELIKLLQDNELGGISHKPRKISLTVNGRYLSNPQITLSSTGDGICGPEIDLDVDGEWLKPDLCENARKAIKTLKENLCSMCAYGSPNMESCDIRSCDNRDAIKALEKEPCEDAISREEMLKYQYYLYGKMPNEENHKLWQFIKSLPSVTPKQKTGKWNILGYDDPSVRFYKCSECHMKITRKFNYCPNCGTKMEGGKE